MCDDLKHARVTNFDNTAFNEVVNNSYHIITLRDINQDCPSYAATYNNSL